MFLHLEGHGLISLGHMREIRKLTGGDTEASIALVPAGEGEPIHVGSGAASDVDAAFAELIRRLEGGGLTIIECPIPGVAGSGGVVAAFFGKGRK